LLFSEKIDGGVSMKKERIVLVASAKKGYGKQIIERQLAAMKKESASIQEKFAKVCGTR
jgi:Mrp family chromosome partitioning ATPase